MASIFWKIGLLVIVLSGVAYTGFVNQIADVISNFNQFVFVYIPIEVRFVVVGIAFGLGIKIYQSLKK